MTIFIHSTAEVHPSATIGDGTKVWKGAQIREGAAIGRNCVLGKDVYVDVGVKIGSGVKVQNGVSIYRGVCVEDDVLIGPHAVFTNDLFPRAHAERWEITPTLLLRGCSIGANATVVCGVTVGAFAMVAAGAVVTRDVPAHALVAGNPARPAGHVCRCGSRIRPGNSRIDGNLWCCPACESMSGPLDLCISPNDSPFPP